MTQTHWKPYPETKNSGIEWAGRIPAHWVIKRLKHLATLHTGGTPTGVMDEAFVDDGTPWVKPDDLIQDRGISCPEKAVTCAEARKLGVAPEGSALVCGIGTIGKFGWATSDVCTNQQINSVAFNSELVPRFGQLTMWGLQFEFERRANKVTIAICNKSAMGEVKLARPPALEQHAIADFLDRETVEIDALVEKKERLIELLQEKRTALITQAVTKGLDPSVPMRDSGIEWLGQIPAHWVSSHLRRILLDRIAGPFGSSLTKAQFGGHTYRVYGQEQVIPGNFAVGDYYIPERKFREMQRFQIAAGDVLVSCVGTFGKVAVVPSNVEPGIINPRLILLRPDKSKVLPEYLELYLMSKASYDQMDERSRGGTMDIINLSLLSDLDISLPSLQEQTDILRHAERETSKIDALIAKVGEAIERLKEYRTALISAAVTGKIDVRGL